MLAFSQIRTNYPHWDRPDEGDEAEWAELLKVWGLNLVGMDDETVGRTLAYYTRYSRRWKGGNYPPGPGDLWVALDEMHLEQEGQAERARTSGQGTRKYDPEAEKASPEVVARCMEQLRDQLPSLKKRTRKAENGPVSSKRP